jgi:hypothetical protein
MVAPIDPTSLATVKVSAIDQSGAKHPATGFLYTANGKTYLVTNWHVLTGRSPDQRATSSTGTLVTHLEVTFHWTPDQKLVVPFKSVNNTYNVLDLTTMRGNWLEHQLSTVDVALVPVELPPNALSRSLDQVEFEPDYDPSVGEEVFVIGFPRNLSVGTSTLPLWKGGTVANDPAVLIDGEPKHLIDCDTYEGMSGSPVIARRQSGLLRTNADGGMAGDSIFGEVRQFFGIYSGRVRRRNLCADEPYAITKFGVVWSAQVIRDILQTPIQGCILR